MSGRAIWPGISCTPAASLDVDRILDVRGPPENRFYDVLWAPGQLGANRTWEPARNLGDFCNGVIQDWFTAHPQWHPQDTVEVEGEIRCDRCNQRDFSSQQQLLRHKSRHHTPPVITGTLAYKKALTAIHKEAHERLPRLVLDGKERDNVWLMKWLGQHFRADGEQEEAVQLQCDTMYRKFHELRHILTDSNTLLRWRLQHYVTGVLSTALHNVGAWLLDMRTQRKLNGVNSKLMAKMTRRSIRQEAKEPTLCAVQWVRAKRARWLGHILREDELSLVKKAVLRAYTRGERGTLMEEAPPHRSIEHLCALAAQRNGFWEDWCKMLERTVLPKAYDGLARSEIRRSLRNCGRRTYDPVPPVVIVPPPTCYNDRRAARVGSTQEGTLSERWDAIFAEALAEVQDRAIYDPNKPTDLYTDGSCSDNGRPFAAAGWGVHVVNSDQLGEYSGALAGQVQTNNRAELAAVEVALRLAWGSSHKNCRIIADCNLACLAIDNGTEEVVAQGVGHGWMVANKGGR